MVTTKLNPGQRTLVHEIMLFDAEGALAMLTFLFFGMEIFYVPFSAITREDRLCRKVHFRLGEDAFNSPFASHPPTCKKPRRWRR